MKVTKQELQKIIQEELSAMQQEGEVDEALGTFLKSFSGGVKDVARSAASGVSSAISAAKEASKKADEEAERAKEETRKAVERVKTDADVEAVIRTVRKQVSNALSSLKELSKTMDSLGMPMKTNTLNMELIMRQLASAHTTLFHAGKVPVQLKKGQGIPGFQIGDRFRSAARTERPTQRITMTEQEQEEE